MKLIHFACRDWALAALSLVLLTGEHPTQAAVHPRHERERSSLNAEWRFWHSKEIPDGIDPSNRHARPAHEPNIRILFVSDDFDDSDWDLLRLPHDWAINGPFYTGEDPEISSDMEVDGAISYPRPYGYHSFQLDLTPYLKQGHNQVAIHVENPSGASSRWYPGAGIYRNVWLTKVNPTHIIHWGTHVTSRDISSQQATVDLEVQLRNKDHKRQLVDVLTDVYHFDPKKGAHGRRVAQFPGETVAVRPDSKETVFTSTTLRNPQLWGPPPNQSSHLYLTITRVYAGKRLVDSYKTQFGVRSMDFAANNSLSVNGVPLRIQGWAAFNMQAAQRQLDMLLELGLLEMIDQMGFLVVDEIFNSWREPDLRSFLRRDRNHPSVVAWSYGNEGGAQGSSDTNAATISTYLRGILVDEDSARPSTASMHRSTPNSSFAGTVNIISLNYQGEGMRYGPAYKHLVGNRKTPQYRAFHGEFPEKLIFGSEVAWSLSSRRTFLFTVTNYTSAPVNDTFRGNSSSLEISAYELYSSDGGSSPDRVFSTQDEQTYIAGGFVADSGIIDLAGFKKERFYLYQARWRPDFPMAHIVPHWTWPDRVEAVTPVHVPKGRLQREPLTYRFRWDSVVYEPGEVTVVTYKNGRKWATDQVQTAGKAAALRLKVDRPVVASDREDLSFVTVEVVDEQGRVVPEADNLVHFSIIGPGEIVATDNGYQADLTAFSSHGRRAFHGLALGIVRPEPRASCALTVKVEAQGLRAARATLTVRRV
ncbi:glycoside hydrolase superfamily [Aspergillus crustosus]